MYKSDYNTNNLLKNDTNNLDTMFKSDDIFNGFISLDNIFSKNNADLNISNQELLLKMNNLIFKVYDKLEKNISFEDSEILKIKEQKKKIVNLICLLILDKIDTLL
jgi:uncharacterized protein YacL (UPF0231 family)